MSSRISRRRTLEEKAALSQSLVDGRQLDRLQRASGDPVVARGRRDGFEARGGAGNRLRGGSASDTHVRTRQSADRNFVVISSNDDDPFARPNHLERLPRSDFTLDARGRPVGLVGPRVRITREDVIYRQEGQQFAAFSNNPWQAARPNADGNFVYASEPRFPSHPVVRGPDGKAVLDARGLQQWGPRELYTGQTIAFEAVNTVGRSMEGWAGREIRWGKDGQMDVQTHAFVGFNAFFNPASRGLFFGVVPYRLPGETEIKMFEVASSWEVAAHEAGHALHNDLKPNRGLVDTGYRQWGESFGDQLAMWSSLQEPARVKQLLQETQGDLNRSSSVTQLAEVFAALVGEKNGMRDAFHQKKVSNTSEQFHARSEVLTGASYAIFQGIYQQQRSSGVASEAAITAAANVMGKFLAKTTEHTPENSMTLEDVAKAYLTVDREYFGGRYQSILVPELERRELLVRPAVDPSRPGAPLPRSSFEQWKAQQAALPRLAIASATDRPALERLLQGSAARLGVPRGFNLSLQSHQTNADGYQVVRVELTRGRGSAAQPVANHGVLVFRKDGSLVDFQSPWPQGLDARAALGLLSQAKDAGLTQKGKPGFVRNAQGQWTVQAIATAGDPRAKRLDLHHRIYSLEEPQGRDIYPHIHSATCGHFQRLKGLLPPGAEVLNMEALKSA